MEFETRAIHAGQPPDPATGAIVTPIYQTSTYVQDEVGKHAGYEYSRTGNPTRAALEACIASLEGASHGLAFSSGMAAEDAVLRLLSPGDHVIIPNDAYGGTYRLIDKVFARAGWTYTPVDMTSLDAVRAAMRDETKMIWIESPTNPLLTVVDIAALSQLGPLTVVDNTFATPYLQQPLALGADIVVHSSTKYLGGHSDVVGGLVALNDEGMAERLAFLQNAVGGVPGPFDCWLTLRGIKTLAVRMERHCSNARAIASMLESHDAVSRVLYPGLPSHPGHDVAARQMRDSGGMVSFIARGGKDAALRIVSATEVFSLAESLGAVESLIEYPAAMTHASVEGSELAVDPALVRLSVGIEAIDDLIADLGRALEA